MTATTTEQLRSQVSRKIRLVTVAMLSAATGHSRTTVWRMVKAGELPKPFKWRGKVVWREADIEKAINAAAGVEE